MKWVALLTLVAGLLATPAPAEAVPVGSLDLHRCRVTARALCGTVEREWEPGHPEAGTVRVGFAFVPARDGSRPALGTLVPHEGGPGYSTTGSVGYYTRMYAGLLDRRNLLLVDQRGTGRSEALDCPDLQDLRIAYSVAAGRCGRSLGERADDYTTALSADDLAAVVAALGLGTLDVYGDSYGTFFAQVFVGRHPDLVRSVVLDGAYPAYGETGWYPTQGPAVRSSFAIVCRRSAACREGGPSWRRALERVLDEVRRHPWRGTAHDADGRRTRVTVRPSSLATVAYGATYGPAFYREMTAALRSALRGDRAPLLRLVAEATGGGTDAGPVRDYSEGLDAAVACHDYPQLYDMTASPAVREPQYRAALTRRTRERPRTYGPFSVREYAASDWQMLDWCTRWPAAPASNPAGPVHPPGGSYPDVPVLVLSGELDSITTPAEGAIITRQFPDATQVVVPNSFHVTALGDTDGCASALVRSFVRDPARAVPAHPCAGRTHPVDALGVFPRTVADLGLRGTAAATVADVVDRWWNNYSGHGVGLRGGWFTYRGGAVTTFRLHRVRLVAGLPVSGRVVWDRYRERITAHLTAGGRPLTLTVHAPAHPSRVSRVAAPRA
ncbi:alpha/beta fold hydrolase [Nocardioides mangrovi]|uniref:Alpha/beta hydrolase n=1 Tax=Nocardioides mangrovi TaxID=2874580 RepID=A0ABS7UHZ3_9ACTN|nr:alpha/beta hydrolase [Nocardioides mangrovi]MBZ5740611.1 alpha/beta hydrolase [Nocardioides mangrovi]